MTTDMRITAVVFAVLILAFIASMILIFRKVNRCTTTR